MTEPKTQFIKMGDSRFRLSVCKVSIGKTRESYFRNEYGGPDTCFKSLSVERNWKWQRREGKW